MIEYRIIPVGSFAVNCAVVSCGEKCVIVDPGQDECDLAAVMRDKGLLPCAALLTHCHFDHIGALPDLLRRFPQLPVYAHPSDWPMFAHPMNALPPEYPSVDRPEVLRDVRKVSTDFPEFGFEILETPGHTPGSVCIKAGKTLFSGDTLFAGSCGRTDFPGGNMTQMRKSLLSIIELPSDIDVIPGHGSFTTIEKEAASNPFIIR